MKMRISSKGKYALELMVYLGRNYGKGSISISEITGDSFSIKYMEKIAALLNKANYPFVLAVSCCFYTGHHHYDNSRGTDSTILFLSNSDYVIA